MSLIRLSDPSEYQPIETRSPLRRQIKRILKLERRDPGRVKRRVLRRVRRRVRAIRRLVSKVRRARSIAKALEKLKTLGHDLGPRVVVIDSPPLNAINTKPIYGQHRVKAVTVLKECAELCARGRKVKNGLGQARLTPELAAEKSVYARELEAVYRNDVSENVDILGMRVEEVFEALEAATDADTAGTLSGTLVLQRTLEFFRINYPMFRKIYTDFSDQPALLNQTLETRSIGTLAVQTYNNQVGADGRPIGWGTVSAPSSTDVQIVVDEHVGVPVVFGANTLSSTLRRLFDEMAPAMSYALAKYFVAKIYALFTPANYNAYALVNGLKVPVAHASYVQSLINFGRSSMVDLNAIMNPNEVPLNDRIVLLNSAYYGQASKDPSLITFWAGQQDPEIITEGELPKMSKFVPIEAPDLPNTNNLVGMALQKNGVVAISRVPQDYTKVLPGASYGTSTMVTDSETGMTVMLVQYVNHTGGYAESRMETMIGGKVGDKRGGLCITSA